MFYRVTGDGEGGCCASDDDGSDGVNDIGDGD